MALHARSSKRADPAFKNALKHLESQITRYKLVVSVHPGGHFVFWMIRARLLYKPSCADFSDCKFSF
jgi:hypothetical protein